MLPKSLSQAVPAVAVEEASASQDVRSSTHMNKINIRVQIQNSNGKAQKRIMLYEHKK